MPQIKGKRIRDGWKAYLFFILLCLGVGILSGLLSRKGIAAYEGVEKSALTPPAFVFPVVWTVLYILMGIGAARVWLTGKSEDRTTAMGFFAFQLIVNFFWSLFFFNRMAYAFAFWWLILLWALILCMILSFRRLDRPAALLQIPYLLWVAFAGYLNYAVWQLNV